MVYSHSPSYYSSFHDSLASLCKSLLLLPFSSHKSRHRQLPSDEDHSNKFAKRQTDNLKWQQDSFHRILHLIGLHKEGLVPEGEVSAFRARLLHTLVASPKDPEPAGLTRDRLLFLQDLLYAECISADQYHSSQGPLLQRLALQGAVQGLVEIDSTTVARQEEERSVIELGERESPPPLEKAKQQTPAKSLFKWKGKAKKDPSTNAGSILMPESSPGVNKSEKRKPFRALLNNDSKSESSAQKPTTKKHWGLDGLKKWRKGDDVKVDESTGPYLLNGDRSEDASTTVVPCDLVASPMDQGRKDVHCDGFAEGEDTKEGEEELNEPLAVDLDAARKELEDQSNAYCGRDSGGWVAFEENEENYNPNLYFRDQPVLNQGMDEANRKVQNKDDCFRNNPFVDDQNPFWATKS